MVISRRTLLLAGASFPASAFAQCVTDSPAVDACRGGVRLTRPAGVTLDLNFMFPGSLDPRIVFTRTTTGTYIDSTGTMQTAAVNQPRWDYDPTTLQLRGMLMEEGRVNLILNSATMSTQSVTTTAVSSTLSFYGAGTITKSGTATGALVGTGTNQRVTQTFTPTAGTLTLTVTGSVTNAQFEAGGFVTSYIPTTGTTAGRAIENASIPLNVSWFNPAAVSLLTEFFIPVPYPGGAIRDACTIHDGTTTNRLFHRAVGGGAAQISSVVAGVSGSMTFGTTSVGVINKIASAWDGVTPRGSFNGSAVQSYSQGLPAGLTTMTIGNTLASSGVIINGHMRRISYWPRSLSDAELQQVTT